ncbi:TIGR02680 family protein [Thiorhodovibrio frisius]|uniref:TIGR02680 family protein n=1 Tax=Thiorhodovibrio frisius TaxID=631362 RepID=H8YZ59_9GAMM|nr:TIGR02680 family protein [Thiorhodovibrio frisius]EIC21986.1 TIGR02680 family protein [Thiorhodovibrio frisius]WPL24275.1 ATPase involved in DNA repair [Thiorhodovibrio frisius]
MNEIQDAPLPLRPRWQPLRLGLVDLFHYDDEEIWLRDGNLLLRGNNGTGKSKVLAMTLPFLLDGQLIPSRVEPDGDPGKRMEWNLLLGGQYQERLGYVWMEFGRDNGGTLEFCTLGCGMRAVAGRGAPERWFFITPQRVRRDLMLVDGNGRALSRDRLLDALGKQGELYTSSAQYRARVDALLFRLGPHRYEALLNLLIQLRQPQLSKRPDEKAMSSALTEALPPLDQSVLNDVADAFRNLEEERKTLDGLNEARASVGDFLQHYRGYCAVAARRRAQAVRQAQGAWEKIGTEVRETAQALREARATKVQEERRYEVLNTKLMQCRARLQTLRDSPEMRDANRLKEASARLVEGRERCQALLDKLERLRADSQRQETRLRTQQQACAKQSAACMRDLSTWLELARSAGIARAHESALAPLVLPDGGPGQSSASDPAIGQAAEAVRCAVQRRTEAIAQVRSLIQALDAARQEEQRHRERREQAIETMERLNQDRVQAAEVVDQQATALVSALRQALKTNRELRLDDPEILLAELQDWCQTLSGDNPARPALLQSYNSARDCLRSAKEAAARTRAEAQAVVTALAEEQDRIERGELAQPPIPYTRDPEARKERDGAPFWQLLEFADSLSANERAGLEAALESSGLLDAWVLPDGTLRDAKTWDRMLGPITPTARNLHQALKIAIDPNNTAAARIAPETLAGILAGIGWGEQAHGAWVDGDGRWCLGPASGAWAKPEPAYIGHAAREAARQRRLREIAETRAQLQQQIQTLSEDIDQLANRLSSLELEWQALPSDQAVRAAHQRHDDLRERLAKSRAAVEHLTGILEQSRAATEHCRDARDKAALDLDLPAETEGLDGVAETLSQYDKQAAAFWPGLRHHWDQLRQTGELAERVSELAEQRAEQADELERATLRQREAEAIMHTLRETLGEGVDQLQRRISDTEQQEKDFQQQQKICQEKQIEISADVSRLGERHTSLTTSLGDRDQQRQDAIDILARFTQVGLLGIATPGLEAPEREPPWPVDPSVRLARQMEQSLIAVDHGEDAWRRQQQGLYDRFQPLQQTLSRYNHSAHIEQDGELLLIRVIFQSRPCGPDELADNLDAEIAERKALLDAKERELLEAHLMSDVATHLQQLIGDGERMVERINKELEHRPTSTGMKLRLAWVPLDEESGAAPAGLAEARKRLLRQTVAAWSNEDRSAVGEFLQRRIDEVRQSDDGGTLIQHLAHALDYRRWHRFTVERWQGGRWRPAYGPASGGERALVVTLPLFAAASSHYGSAAPKAPRLVMLDEAFAGIDDDSRAKCLGLMAQFDLDFMLTSEREWGCYAEVPGLAIAQLVRQEGIDAVYISRWTWDGVQRRPDETPPMRAPVAEEADVMEREDHDPQQSLL